MHKTYSTPILFKIDEETLARLDRAANELGHTRSLFIRNAINLRVSDYETRERDLILSLKQRAPVTAPERRGTDRSSLN
jgi:predicted DNA-binding protein